MRKLIFFNWQNICRFKRVKVTLDHVVGIVVTIGVYLTFLKPGPINSAWSKTYIWTPRSTFYDARELNYTLKWP